VCRQTRNEFVRLPARIIKNERWSKERWSKETAFLSTKFLDSIETMSIKLPEPKHVKPSEHAEYCEDFEYSECVWTIIETLPKVRRIYCLRDSILPQYKTACTVARKAEGAGWSVCKRSFIEFDPDAADRSLWESWERRRYDLALLGTHRTVKVYTMIEPDYCPCVKCSKRQHAHTKERMTAKPS
jgi:hypothetical protein